MVKTQMMWKSDQEDGTYINPVLHADYSDPDVIRVGDRYIMVASSFNCMPGLPILVSYDLVNWELANYAIQELPFEIYNTPAHAKGVWAPSIRYHNDKYWIYFATPDEGIFMTTAEDPLGEWSPLVCVKRVKGWIDPCPLWDTDGQAYLVYGFAKSRIGFNSMLGIAKMSPDGTSLLDEGQIVFDGTKDHPTIEGPKFYKKDDYYYIFAPAGGVRTGWQTVLRSKNVMGPYKDKIVLHQGDTDINGPHQGGWVDTPNGEHWFIHFQEKGIYGRIVHLQPMEWKEDGWPIIGVDINNDGIGEPVIHYKKPTSTILSKIIEPGTSEDFSSNNLGLQWQWFANPKDNYYSLTDRTGFLRLFAVNNKTNKVPQRIWETSNLLLQKFVRPGFQVETYMEFNPDMVYDQAGIVITGEQYAYVSMIKENNKYKLQYVQSRDANGIKEEKVMETCYIDTNAVYLKVIVSEEGHCDFGYSKDKTNYVFFSSKFISEKSQWIGAKVGIFAMNSNNEASKGWADFKYFNMEGVFK